MGMEVCYSQVHKRLHRESAEEQSLCVNLILLLSIVMSERGNSEGTSSCEADILETHPIQQSSGVFRAADVGVSYH
jgi:hypothetical protein